MARHNQPDRRWMFLFVFAAMLLGASRWRVSGQSAGLIPVANREPTPNLTLPQLGGGQWTLADHRGQVVLLNFWATWCEPCRDELPDLLQVVRQSAPHGLAAVGVSMDSGPDAQAQVRQFVSLFRLPYPIAFPDAAMSAGANGIGVPTTVLLDKQGRRAKTYVGELDRVSLARDIAALQSEP
jgi:cytochrome c biogenesis protein CcmG/thiol:disulfide interchange protein DsbE